MFRLLPHRIASTILLTLLSPPLSPAAQIKLGDRTFTLPDGFTIEQVAGPGLVDRPVVADFDPLGRLYVADASGTGDKVQKQLADKPHRILRLDPDDATGHFTRSTVFAPHMMFPEGVMYFAGSIYVGAPPSIWKLTAIDDTGLAKQEEEWLPARTLTNCANDIHGPYMGPDGWIYWCKGAFAEQTYARPGKKPMVSRAAHIFRARPDGTGLEPVMTGGMDNPVHVVFTPTGERIFTTTFLQNPENGKRDGIIHAVYGGIYGKVHDVIDDHPHTSPDVMPVLVHLGPAAACGLARYESDSFGSAYRDNLFATSFNLHKVTRHLLKPDGATFAATDEDFLVCDSVDFHPTEVLEGADGSLLVIDTGGWYKLCCPTSQFAKPDVLGAIYRVKRVGVTPVQDPRGLAINWDSADASALIKLLDDPRPFVRKRATQALADHNAVLPLSQALHSDASPRRKINAVWALTRIDSAPARKAVRDALADPDESVRQVAAHSAAVWRDKGAQAALLTVLDAPSAHNRRAAAEALGRVGDRRAIPNILAKLRDPNDRVLDHSLTYALIEIGDAPATHEGLKSDNAAVRRSAMIALDQMDQPALSADIIAANLTATDSPLRQTATWIAGRHPEWGQTLQRAFAQRLASGQDDNQLAEQLAKLSKSEAIAQMLADQLNDPRASTSQRRIILSAMTGSGLSPAPKSWLESIRSSLASSDVERVSDVAAAIPHLRIKPGSDSGITQALLTVSADPKNPADLRLQALAAIPGKLTALHPDQIQFLISQLRPGSTETQRTLAIQALSRSKLTSDQLISLTGVLNTAGALEIGPLIDAFAQSADDTVGTKLIETLETSKAAAALHPDALDKVLARFSPQVKSRAQAFLAKLNPDASTQQARLDQLLTTLPPGDVRRGQTLFNSPKAACYSCHQIGYLGGHVGPDLTKVGAIRTRRDLLESLVYPSASFVQSFEPVTVLLTTGERQYGILRRNDATEILLVTGPTQEIHIPKNDITDIRPGTLSLMPAGFADQLSPQDLSDLLAFLTACK